MDWDGDLVDEKGRMRDLRRVVDFTTSLLSAVPLPESEAQSLIEECRRRVLELFPDKADVFDLIYPPRFERARARAWEDFDERSVLEWLRPPSDPM